MVSKIIKQLFFKYHRNSHVQYILIKYINIILQLIKHKKCMIMQEKYYPQKNDNARKYLSQKMICNEKR